MKRHVGEVVKVTCGGCPTEFEYTFTGGRPRLYCATCAHLRQRASIRVSSQNIRNLEKVQGMPSSRNLNGLGAITAMSQEECAAKLAVWEALDNMLKTGTLVDPKPLTKQRIQQIERRVLRKIRIACRGEYEAYKSSREDEPVNFRLSK